MEFAVATSGSWPFSNSDVLDLAASIVKDYANQVRTVPRSRAMLILAPFPLSVGPERWTAETRGGTVLLLSGVSSSRTAGLAQLSVPLTHELFHLWVPNGLALVGSYDWFYEGFTLYQALRSAMRLNLLTFQDYLNTLGRTYDRYYSLPDRSKISLLQSSQGRWISATDLVYNKGLLVAFLYDLSLRKGTNGKRTLDDVYRELFRIQRKPVEVLDANSSVIAALIQQGGTKEFIARFISGTSEIDLASAVEPFGLRVEKFGARTVVSVAPSPTRQQRDLLSEFGYNEKPRVRQRASGK